MMPKGFSYQAPDPVALDGTAGDFARYRQAQTRLATGSGRVVNPEGPIGLNATGIEHALEILAAQQPGRAREFCIDIR